MQSTAQFKLYLEQRGFRLRADGDALYVDPRSRLTLEEIDRIMREKAALLALLQPCALVGVKPYFNANGDLVIEQDTDDLFKWWKPDGQSLAQTLADLDANSKTIRRYLARSDAPLHTAMAVRDCASEIVRASDGLTEYCVECGWFVEVAPSSEVEMKHQELITALGF